MCAFLGFVNVYKWSFLCLFFFVFLDISWTFLRRRGGGLFPRGLHLEQSRRAHGKLMVRDRLAYALYTRGKRFTRKACLFCLPVHREWWHVHRDVGLDFLPEHFVHVLGVHDQFPFGRAERNQIVDEILKHETDIFQHRVRERTLHPVDEFGHTHHLMHDRAVVGQAVPITDGVIHHISYDAAFF